MFGLIPNTFERYILDYYLILNYIESSYFFKPFLPNFPF